MTNSPIAELFKEIAGHLELEGENPYRIRAYKRAAEAIDNLSEPLANIAMEGRIQGIPGIGKDLEQKILDLLSHGEIRESPEKYTKNSAYPSEEISEKASEKTSNNKADYFSIPGLDPKIMRLLHKRFRMETREDLENLARSRLLRTVPELGTRIESLILKAFKNTTEPEGKKGGSRAGTP